MENIERTGSAEGQPAQQRSAEPEFVHEFTNRGKTIKATLDQLKKWGPLGYDYAQQMGEINKMRERMKTLERWEEYETFAQQNPDWARHVNDSWEKRAEQVAQAQGLDPNHPIVREITALKSQLSDALGFINSSKQEKEDHALSAETESVRKQYPDIDFDLPDDTGKSLEMQVLEHARKENIRSFRAAFRDFYHERLVKRHEDKALERVSKGRQADRRRGVVDTHGAAPNEIDKLIEDAGLNVHYQ